jgi:hypothetical protein
MAKKTMNRRSLLKAAITAGVGLAAGGPQAVSGRSKPVLPAPGFKCPTVKTVADYQLAAATIASHVHQDPAFAAQVRADPVKALTAAGLQGDALRELVSEDAWLRSMAGNALAREGCSFSCLCASSGGCCVTCWLGTNSRKSSALDFNLVHFGAPDPTLRVSPQRQKLLDSLVTSGHICSPQTP